jgi:hypothetical protein
VKEFLISQWQNVTTSPLVISTYEPIQAYLFLKHRFDLRESLIVVLLRPSKVKIFAHTLDKYGPSH